jgi:hypothetical protein
MANCRHCGTALPGRRQACDECKAKGRKRKPAPPKKPAADAAAAVEPDPEDAPPAPTHPPGLHLRGKALWDALGQQTGTAGGELALEACRLADRLNELDRIIAGKGVMQLMKFRLDHIDWDDDEKHITVKVGFQSVLSEARMQQGAFKEVLKALRVITAAAPGTPAVAAPAATPTPQPAANGLDEVMMRRLQREQASS